MAVAVITPDLKPIAESIGRAEKLLGSPTPILNAFGIATVGWIGLTFREEGRPKWKPLTPWTMAGRREGKGKGSARVLQDNGKLRNSFDFRVTDRAAVVFSNADTAVFHQYGTKGPYKITAKNGKALALPMLGLRGDGSGRIAGQKSLAGLGRSKAKGNGGYLVTQAGRNAPARVKARTGQSIAPYKNVTFLRSVTHPGLVARPMLPTDAQALPMLDFHAKRIINLALRVGAAGATAAIEGEHQRYREDLARRRGES